MVAPFSQMLEPPSNPGRFRATPGAGFDADVDEIDTNRTQAKKQMNRSMKTIHDSGEKSGCLA